MKYHTAVKLFLKGYSIKWKSWDLPAGAVVKNPPANAGHNAGDQGSSPGPGRSHIPRSN